MPVAEKQRRPRADGERSRQRILQAAAELATVEGLDGLSIGRLADHVGMSKSGLFAHFRSKEQLQLQTLDHAAARFTDIVVRPALKTPRGERRVRELFERWLDWETEALAGGCVFVAASNEYDDQPGQMHDALLRHQRDWTEFITTVAGTAVSEGHFRADLDPGQFAFELQGLMLGYHHSGRLLRDPRALERARSLHRPVILRCDDVEVAKIIPLRTTANTSNRRTKQDYEEFLSTLGAWQPDIDIDRLKAELKASRGSRRPPVDLWAISSIPIGSSMPWLVGPKRSRCSPTSGEMASRSASSIMLR